MLSMKQSLVRLILLSMCLCLLPLGAFAREDAAEAISGEITGYEFDVSFEMHPEYYAEEQQMFATAAAGIINPMTLSGTYASDGVYFNLAAEMMLNGAESTRTPISINGTKDQWLIRSSLLGEEIINLHLVYLLEFAVKGYNHMQVPYQRAAILLTPFVDLIGMDELHSQIAPPLEKAVAQRQFTKKAMLEFADIVQKIALENRGFRYWVAALLMETGYNDVFLECLSQLRSWVEETGPSRGITVTGNESQQSWMMGQTEIYRWEKDETGTERIRLHLPSLPMEYTVTCKMEQAASGEQDLMLLITDWAEETVIYLTMEGSLPTALPLSGPFTLRWHAEGVAVGPEPIDLYLDGWQEGENITLRQLTPDQSQTLMAIRLRMAPTDVENFVQEANVGTHLTNLNTQSLGELTNNIAMPLLEGVLPLLVELPASTCQKVMDLLDESGIFGLLTESFFMEESLEGEGIYDEEW